MGRSSAVRMQGRGMGDASDGWKQDEACGMRCKHGARDLRSDAGLGPDVWALALPSNAQERASVRLDAAFWACAYLPKRPAYSMCLPSLL
jgi:hypothetical protein